MYMLFDSVVHLSAIQRLYKYVYMHVYFILQTKKYVYHIKVAQNYGKCDMNRSLTLAFSDAMIYS